MQLFKNLNNKIPYTHQKASHKLTIDHYALRKQLCTSYPFETTHCNL